MAETTDKDHKAHMASFIAWLCKQLKGMCKTVGYCIVSSVLTTA